MIRAVNGCEVGQLLEHVRSRIEEYAEVLVCSPFIDAPMIASLVSLAQEAQRVQCGFRVITCTSPAASLLAALPGHALRWRDTVVIHRQLHAKAYIAIGRKRRAKSQAIVTSANLTLAGITTNLEFGVLAVSTSTEGRHLLAHIHHFVRQLVA